MTFITQLPLTILGQVKRLPWKNWQQRRFGHRFGLFYGVFSRLHFLLARLIYDFTHLSYHSTRLDELKKRGFHMTRCEVDGLATAFTQLMQRKTQQGRCKLTQAELAELAVPLADCLRQVQTEVEQIYGTYFRINLMSASRLTPSQEEPNSSFLYHYDNVPWPSLKVFFYLNDQRRDTGAFRLLDWSLTQTLLEQGFDSSSAERRKHSQTLVTQKVAEQLRVAEGEKGTVLVWHNRLIHKATLPERGERDLVQVEIMPALFPRNFLAQLRHPREENTTWELIGRSL